MNALFITKKATLVSQIFFFTLLPIVGILFLDWGWQQILVLYFLKSISLAITTTIKMRLTLSSNIRIIPKSTTKFLSDTPQHVDPKTAQAVAVVVDNNAKIAAANSFMFGTIILSAIHAAVIFSLVNGTFTAPLTNQPSSVTSFITIPVLLIWLLNLGWEIATTIAAANQSKVENKTITITIDNINDPANALARKEAGSFLVRFATLHLAMIFGTMLTYETGFEAITGIVLIIIHTVISFTGWLSNLTDQSRQTPLSS